MSRPKLKRKNAAQRSSKAPHPESSCCICGKKAAILGFFIPFDRAHWKGHNVLGYCACRKHAPKDEHDLSAYAAIEQALSDAIAYREREQVPAADHPGNERPGNREEIPFGPSPSGGPAKAELTDLPSVGIH